MAKKRNILSEIRKDIAPRKKRNGDGELKKYDAIRLPEELVREFKILKLAYELMWSDKSDLESLTNEELEVWEMEHMTQEEFFRRLYDGALRIDPDVKKYIDTARRAYESRKKFEVKTNEDLRRVILDLFFNTKGAMVNTPLQIQEEAVKDLEENRKFNSTISPELSNMAGTIPPPSDNELCEDPRLQEAVGEKDQNCL